MSLKDNIVGMTVKSILRKRIRSGLTILGIAIGIMLVTALLMVANGLEDQFQRVIEKGGGDFVLVERDASDLMLSRVDGSIRTALEEMEGVSWASAMTFSVTKIGENPYTIILGVEPRESTSNHFLLVEGQHLSKDDTGKIILGRMISMQEGLPIGEHLDIKGSTYEIIGIYEAGTSFEDSGGCILLNEAQSLFGFGEQVSILQVKADLTTNVDSLRDAIEKEFPQVLVLKSSEVAAHQEDLQLIIGISALISLIAILVGSIGIMNTMMMSVMERTREIGILRAIGWKKREILSMILKESMAMSILGGSIGIVAAATTVTLLIKGIDLPVDIPVTVDLVISALLIALLLGVLGGIYPALRASRMSPLEALTHE
ncbi:MAG: ABC transporter permease [Theionarchaea archaeon]|nr:ABC transporter permease [Theionarchaea archaeon]